MLREMVRYKLRELREAKGEVPLESLRRSLADVTPTRDLLSALQDRKPAIIAEIKRRSPSAGWIRPQADPGRIAELYQEAGAAAISVLTEQRYFGGHPTFLRLVRTRVSIPVLRKDFIVDPYQIYESRALGADGVLLIASLLKGKRLDIMVDLAHSLGLCALVEVHTEEQLQMALEAGARLVGINNRDLRTLRTELTTTMELAPLVPKGVTLVSESGISCRKHVKLLMDAGVGAFLVGEALMRAPDPAEKLQELLGKEKNP